MIPACLLQMLPDVQPNDGGYDCDNDGFIFNDRVPVQETLANTKPLVEAVISTLDVTACVPLDLAVKLVKKVNFVFATILEDIQC